MENAKMKVKIPIQNPQAHFIIEASLIADQFQLP